jgi:hypothetical protein
VYHTISLFDVINNFYFYQTLALSVSPTLLFFRTKAGGKNCKIDKKEDEAARDSIHAP